MLAVKYALTKEDYINFYTYVMWDAPGNKKKRVIFYGRQLIPILLFLMAFYFTGLLDRKSNFILLIAGFIVLTAFVSLAGVRTNTMKQAEKITEDPDNASLFIDVSLSAGEAGIVVKDELKEIRYQWSSVIKKLESKNYYFLFHNGIQAIIIPKRAFGTEQQMAFNKILAQYLSFDADVSHLLKN